MGDWPGIRASLLDGAPCGPLSTYSPGTEIGGHILAAGVASTTAAVWPAALRALYNHIIVAQPVTAYEMAIEVTTQAGNVDVGIYDVNLNRLVAAGTTATGAAGLQVFNIADTALAPGDYYVAMVCDSATAAFRRATPDQRCIEVAGGAQQLLGAMPLPASAVFALPASAYVPHVMVATQAAAV